MTENDNTSAVIRHRHDSTLKPYELCVEVTSSDGQTRLDHEDYLLSERELMNLRERIDKMLASR